MVRKRFAMRTVKNGSVKINGRIFVPDRRYDPYDGRFDGKRFAFGLYYNSTPDGWVMDNKISLWGSEREFRGSEFGFDTAVNGTLPWMWWFEEA